MTEALQASPARERGWIERLWASIAERGRRQPATGVTPKLDRACLLADTLLSELGEASGAVLAQELQTLLAGLGDTERLAFSRFVATHFGPDQARLRAAAEAYLSDSGAANAGALADAAEPVRQELLRRMNMPPGGTAALVRMRQDLLPRLRSEPALRPLDADLRHLFGSWFNRGFLELRRIDWQTPAAVLEKLLEYEAVHAIAGWQDLRRRLAPDRRCFGFFHPALPGEPLIFVEVALVQGLATAIAPLLAPEPDAAAAVARAASADTAIFYSISNCQEGLRGVSFGNFLIKQVVTELKTELPRLARFSTLSPVPKFRAWYESTQAAAPPDGWWTDPVAADPWRDPLMRACAAYLTRAPSADAPIDPVARFHLGNGARLERIDWLGNTGARGMAESYGVMVNYLYDPDTIEANHEAFVRDGVVIRSAEVDRLLAPPRGRRNRAAAGA